MYRFINGKSRDLRIEMHQNEDTITTTNSQSHHELGNEVRMVCDASKDFGCSSVRYGVWFIVFKTNHFY